MRRGPRDRAGPRPAKGRRRAVRTDRRSKRGLFEGGVVDEDFAGEGLEDFAFGLLVGGVGLEIGKGLAVGEAHEEGEVERVVDDGAIAGDGAAVTDAADQAGGFLEVFGGADEGAAVFVMAGALEPDEHGVFDPAAGRGGATRGQETKQEGGEAGHGLSD